MNFRSLVMPGVLKWLLTLAVAVSSPGAVIAQDWAFVYIQGDKQTPFYVKLEGEMLPRYGKNYCIIPKLAAGPINLEILYQQNSHPSQKYTIQVPELGYRGFLLVKKEGSYTLYDLQQQFYLAPGDQDRLPETKETEELPTVASEESAEKEPVSEVNHEVEVNQEPVLSSNVKTTGGSEPTFIENLVLKTPKEEQLAIANQNVPAQPAAINLESGEPAIPNSDCPSAMQPKEFSEVMNYLPELGQNDKLIVYFLKKATSGCFSTFQVYQLASRLKSESVRFTFLKNVYSRVTDQQNFFMLESHLFESNEWKEYFRSIK